MGYIPLLRKFVELGQDFLHVVVVPHGVDTVIHGDIADAVAGEKIFDQEAGLQVVPPQPGNQDMGILSLKRIQILPQNGLTAHGVHQRDLHAGELDVSRHQVNALRVVQDTLAGTQRLVHQDTSHRVGQGKGQLVRLRVAPADCQTVLRVPVDQQHFLPGLRQPDPQVRAGGCLANAAFPKGKKRPSVILFGNH